MALILRRAMAWACSMHSASAWATTSTGCSQKYSPSTTWPISQSVELVPLDSRSPRPAPIMLAGAWRRMWVSQMIATGGSHGSVTLIPSRLRAAIADG